MKKTVYFLIAVLLVIGYGCCNPTKEVVEEKDFIPKEADDKDLIALTSQELELIFVKEGYKEQVAERFMIEDPSSDQWTMILGFDQKDTVSLEVVMVPIPLSEQSAYKIGDIRVYKGYKCTGNSPAKQGKCIRRPGNVNQWYRKETLGYSYCQRSQNPEDICEVVYTNTAVWVYFSDKCQTVTRRSNWQRPRWVCIP